MTAHDGNQGMNQSGQPGPAELSESRYSGAGILLGWKSRECWEVLLAKRGEEPFLGYWSVPGGGRSHSDPSPWPRHCERHPRNFFKVATSSTNFPNGFPTVSFPRRCQSSGMPPLGEILGGPICWNFPQGRQWKFLMSFDMRSSRWRGSGFLPFQHSFTLAWFHHWNIST